MSPFGRVPLPPHGRERERVAPGNDAEVQEAARLAGRVAGDDVEIVALPIDGGAGERHRVPGLAAVAAPARGDLGDARRERLVDRTAAHGLGAVALALEPGHRLPHLADRAPLEREGCRIHDGFVARVVGAQSGVAPEREALRARAQHAQRPSRAARRSGRRRRTSAGNAASSPTGSPETSATPATTR